MMQMMIVVMSEENLLIQHNHSLVVGGGSRHQILSNPLSNIMNPNNIIYHEYDANNVCVFILLLTEYVLMALSQKVHQLRSLIINKNLEKFFTIRKKKKQEN